jgi:hypothetical protein
MGTFQDRYKDCAAAIDAAVNAVYTPGEMAGTGTYDLKAALNELIDKYGKPCVTEVIAAIVNENEHDGRFSEKNKAWARTFDPVELEDAKNSLRYSTVNTHRAVLDGLTRHAREAHLRESLSGKAEQSADEKQYVWRIDINGELDNAKCKLWEYDSAGILSNLIYTRTINSTDGKTIENDLKEFTRRGALEPLRAPIVYIGDKPPQPAKAEKPSIHDRLKTATEAAAEQKAPDKALNRDLEK